MRIIKKITHTKNNLTDLKMFFVLVFSIAILLGIYSRTLVLRQELKQLPNLGQSKIELPGPLVLAKESSSVLGFGTFDPFEVIDAVNDERTKSGASPLRANETLMKAAAMRAQTILDNENFSHQDPYEHIELGSVLPRLKYNYVYASENIGMGGNSGRDFVNGFMNSTSHRINLLNPELTDTGVAVVDGPFERYYVNIVVQIFSIPGGVDEYRGYSQTDKLFFETQFTSVSTKLDPLTWWVLQLSEPAVYTEDKRKTLEEQKNMLHEVVAVMRSEKPLENSHVILIRKYNSLL